VTEFTASTGQAEAIAKIAEWYADGGGTSRESGVFRLFGYAGTGKTTLVRHVIAELGLADNPEGVRWSEVIDKPEPDSDDPEAEVDPADWTDLATDGGRTPRERHPWAAFGAYTGKAAHVLQRKGVPAHTIHSMIYSPVEKSREHLRALERQLKEYQDPDRDPPVPPMEISILESQIAAERKRVRSPSFAFNPDSEIGTSSLIVLDEVSMVDERMAADLLSFGVPILAIGDPAQLPPVGGDGYFTAATPDVLLTEVHRSALDSPITRIATAVRAASVGDVSFGVPGLDSGSGRLFRLPSADSLLEADAVLCWRNAVRWNLIRQIRAMLGRAPGVPVHGDEIMILANNRDQNVFNGQIFTVLGAWGHPRSDPYTYELAVEDADGSTRMLEAMASGFHSKDGEDAARDAVRFGGAVVAATFAQAITVHKSQGSEWDSVLVIDEAPSLMAMKNRQGMGAAGYLEAQRWMYTACTRAARSLTIAPAPI
jgi:exodeoxyribonuclease-5